MSLHPLVPPPVVLNTKEHSFPIMLIVLILSAFFFFPYYLFMEFKVTFSGSLYAPTQESSVHWFKYIVFSLIQLLKLGSPLPVSAVD